LTTIVYRAGILAGEQRVVDGESIMPGTYQKVFKNDKGWLWGCAGETGPMWAFNDFMREFKPDKLPNAKMPRAGSYDAIVIDPKGQIYLIENGWTQALPETVEFYAIGAGMEAALGALYHGATAVEAVECAIKANRSSGGNVDFVMLDIKGETNANA
jgi:20S proteasome alpha/beta subunit